MSELYLVAESARQAEAAGLARALGDAGLPARVVGREEVPADAVRLVFADQIDDVLEAVAVAERARWAECTLLVNETRERVLGVLERHGLLGALEYEEIAEWQETDFARLFACKAVVAGHGEIIEGEERESDHYGLWTNDEDSSLSAILKRFLALWERYDAEMVFGADQAIASGLPPVELRLRVGGTGLWELPGIPRPAGFYLKLSGPPGGLLGVAAWNALPDERGAAGIERSVRRAYHLQPERQILVPDHCRLVIAGAEREAACLVFNDGMMRSASCVVRIDHAGGALMVDLMGGIHGERITCEELLAQTPLGRIARSLRVSVPGG